MAKISNIGTFVARALGYSTLILTIPGQGQNPPMSQPQFGPKWTFGDPRVRLLKETGREVEAGAHPTPPQPGARVRALLFEKGNPRIKFGQNSHQKS